MSATATSFYVAGGTLPYDAPSYVERKADKDLHDALARGEFCYVLTARQMGKSSLMTRTAVRLREEGFQVVVLDLTEIGQNLSAEQWYNGLLILLGQQLKLETELKNFCNDRAAVGPCQRFFMAIREVALPNLSMVSSQLSVAKTAPNRRHGDRVPATDHGPRTTDNVVIFVDEIDIVRSLPFSTDEFFAAIRACYNRRAKEPEFQRLTFCLLGVATPSDLIRDTRLTPFNIGRRIDLDDFTTAEAAPLAKGLARNEQVGCRFVERVFYWTSGHPYLTQRLCQAIAENEHGNGPKDVDRLCSESFLSARARERDDNIIFVRERLLNGEVDRASLLDLYSKIRKGKRVADDDRNPLISVLKLSGITRTKDGYLQVRNRIYRQAFDPDWILSNMPNAEVRRQRAALKRGALGAATAAIVILAVLLSLDVLGPGPGKVVVVAIQGTVEISPAGSTNWLRTQTNQVVQAGDRLRMGANSRATLRWSDQSVLTFGALTEIEILPPHAPGLHLFRGILSFFHRDENGRIRVRTRGAQEGVEG